MINISPLIPQQELQQTYDPAELWKSLVESTPDFVVVTETDGTILYINRVVHGLRHAEVTGKTLYDYIPDTEHRKMRQTISRAIGSGMPQHLEITGTGPVPATAWYETHVIPVKRGEQVTRLIFVSSDITSRKRLEQQQQDLVQREQKARVEAESAKEHVTRILTSITDGFFSIDHEWCIAYANDQAAQLVGKQPDELIGRNYWEAFPEARDSIFGAEYRRCMRERVSGAVEAFYAPLDRWFAVRCYPSADGLSIFFQDITQQKQAEQALRESEERFRTMFQQSAVSMAITDSQRRFCQVNRAFCQLLGYSAFELLQLSVADITHPDDCVENFYQLEKTIAEERPTIDIEKRYLHKDGSVVWVRVSGVFIYDANQQFKYSVAVIQDMTRYREAESARQELLRRLMMAQEEERLRLSRELHDHMGQHLAALLLGLESLPDQTPLLPEGLQKVHGLQVLTRQLMEQARSIALSLRPEMMDRLGLDMALQRKVKDWTGRTGIPVAFHSNNTLDRRFPSEIEMTIYRVTQEALTNITRHAQATQVTVLLKYRNNQLAVIIEDNGRGFDTDAVLDPAAPIENLGLMGMRERAALVDGTIDIESSIGSGVSIFLRIPIKSECGVKIRS